MQGEGETFFDDGDEHGDGGQDLGFDGVLGSAEEALLTSCNLLSEMWIKRGMAPRRSSKVCNLMAALVE